MRRLFLGTLAACQLAVGSNAAATCASPQELKALQAAALEQQLAAAAQSCHFATDYSLFVARYRGAIVRSDHAVKAFFQGRTNSEGYDVFKTRIAQNTSLRSLHDPQFCRSAKAVFDMALGRDGAGKAPAMVQTGYEHCKIPVRPRTVVVTTTMPAARALSLAEPEPALAAAPVPKPAPKRVVQTVKVLTPRLPVRAMGAAPRAQTEHPDTAEPSNTTVEPWRPGSVQPHASDAYDELDKIPNAYKPGSVWVGAEARGGLPKEHQRPLVMGPDGRWYVPIGHQENWQQD